MSHFKAIEIGKSWVVLWHHWQPYPRFSLVYRLRRYREAFEFGIILFGHWFTCTIDHPILARKKRTGGAP